MLRVGIIDADLASCNLLQRLLEENFPEVEVIASTTSAEEAMRMIRSYVPDLIFVDIKLQRITGFELLEELEDLDLNVIFTTRNPVFNMPPTKHSRIEILLKPIKIDALSNALNSLEKALVLTRKTR